MKYNNQIQLFVMTTICMMLFFVPTMYNKIISYAEEVELKEFPGNLRVWIPNNMILGETYEGIIISDTQLQNNLKIITKTSSDIDIPSIIVLPANTNSVIFPITPLFTTFTNDAKIEFFKDINQFGSVGEIRTSITNHKEINSLKIVIPTETYTKDIVGYVYLVGDDGKFVIPEQDITIYIGNLGNDIVVPEEPIIITAGEVIKEVEIHVNGSGEIIAYSPGLNSVKINIELKEEEEISLYFDVVPKVAKAGDKMYYYIWLQKGDKPHKLNHVVTGYITSSDTSVISPERYQKSQDEALGNEFEFNRNQEIITNNAFDDVKAGPLPTPINLINGFAKGEIYAGNDGGAVVRFTLPEYGTVDVKVDVGLGSNDGKCNEGSTSTNDEEVEEDVNNEQLRSWIVPPITDRETYLIISKLETVDVKVLNDDYESEVDEVSEEILNVLQEVGIAITTNTALVNKVADNLKAGINTPNDVLAALERYNLVLEEERERDLAEKAFNDILKERANIDISDNNDGRYKDICITKPAPLHDFTFVISNDGSIENSPIRKNIGSEYTIEIPIINTEIGSHSISISANDVDFAQSEGGNTMTEYNVVDITEDYTIDVKLFPRIDDPEIPIGMLLVERVEGDGGYITSENMRDKINILAYINENNLIFDDVYHESTLLYAHENLVDNNVDSDTLHIYSNRISTSDRDYLDGASDRIETILAFDAPTGQYINEEFPFTMHVLSSADDNIALSRLTQDDFKILSNNDENIIIINATGSNDRIIITGGEKGSVIKFKIDSNDFNYEPTEPQIKILKNVFDITISGISEGNIFDIRDETVVDIIGIGLEDVIFTIHTDANYETISNTKYKIIPVFGRNVVDITAEKIGYETYHESISFEVTKKIVSNIRAVQAHGLDYASGIPIIIDIKLSAEIHQTPYTYNGKFEPIALDIPTDYNPEGGGLNTLNYTVISKTIIHPVTGEEIEEIIFKNDSVFLLPDVNSNIIIVFTKGANIEISGADVVGVGPFQIGTEVLIEVREKEIIPYILYEKFSYWEGDLEGASDGSFYLTVTNDVRSTAIYENDYGTIQAIVILIIILVASLVIILRNENVRYALKR